jgi:hypothetical protein
MMIMIPNGYSDAAPGTMPDAKLVEKMMAFNNELTRAGAVLAMDGLHPPSMGTRVRFGTNGPKATDGPFAEAKEVIGGYWLLQAKSKEEVVQWALKCPAQEGDIIEIRQVQEMADFPEEIQRLAQAG